MTSTQLPRKTALLLMNLGGPKDLDSVGPFLTNLFSDKDLIPLPFQSYTSKFISKRRTPKVQELYKNIGGGSPILHWTTQQGRLLADSLNSKANDSKNPNIPLTISNRHFTPYIAFRYTEPFSQDAVAQMLNDGIQDAVVLTLYPQYSCSTTGSSLNDLTKKIKNLDPTNKINWSVIDRFPTNDKLANVIADHIIEGLEKNYSDLSTRDDVVLLFSAHSLPMVVVNRGDPYPGEVAASVSKVMEKLPQKLIDYEIKNKKKLISGNRIPYRIVWQSQVGPQPWLGPSLDKTIEGYSLQKKNNLLVIPIAFVSDHIETLSEIDIEYGKLAKDLGVVGFKRVESLNDDSRFISALEDVVINHFNENKDGMFNSSYKNSLLQWKIKCPGCKSESCTESREFFS